MTSLDDPQAGTSTTDWVACAQEIGASLRPQVDECDRTGQINAEAFELLRRAGVTAALVPSDFGGGGATHATMGEILRALGSHDPATAVTLAMHSHIVATQVWRHRHGMDAEKVFREVVDDRAVLVSTGASDWVGSNGSATKVDGGYRVRARKLPASGCEVGHVLVASIRWDDAPDGPQVLHCSVPFSAEGVSIEQTWDTLGWRAPGPPPGVLDDVFVPDGAVALVRPADEWPAIWNVVLGSALPLIMAAYVGVADAAVRQAVEAVAGRSDPHVLQLVGEMLNAHTTAMDTVAAMFADADDLQFNATDVHSSRTLSRKAVASDAVIETVRLALEVTGGFGYTRSSEIERLYRDAHGCLFHPLPRAKQTTFSGRVALGLSPIT